jgi:hypothetical protein
VLFPTCMTTEVVMTGRKYCFIFFIAIQILISSVIAQVNLIPLIFMVKYFDENTSRLISCRT